MKRKLLRSEQGFTLVELMIVVVIMGILVAVAIPIYGGLTNRAERQTCHSNCEIIEKAAVQYDGRQRHFERHRAARQPGYGGEPGGRRGEIPARVPRLF